MRRIKVGIEGNGTVRIKLKKKNKADRIDITATGGVPLLSSAPLTPAAGRQGFSHSHPIINQMEIMV